MITLKAGSIKYTEHSRLGMTLYDGKRCLAVARPAAGGWLLSAKSMCWVNRKARTPNVIGIVDPTLMVLKTRREARDTLQSFLIGAPS